MSKLQILIFFLIQGTYSSRSFILKAKKAEQTRLDTSLESMCDKSSHRKKWIASKRGWKSKIGIGQVLTITSKPPSIGSLLPNISLCSRLNLLKLPPKSPENATHLKTLSFQKRKTKNILKYAAHLVSTESSRKARFDQSNFAAFKTTQ